MRLLAPLLILVLFIGTISGQITNLAAIYDRSDETFSYLLFNNGNMIDAFVARSVDLAQDHPRLTLSGDFTGDGVDELAVFNDLLYKPNMNPDFTCSVISISSSRGGQFIPSGTWFSALETQLDFENVSFSVAGDYNMDGLTDIALFYNDPGLEILTIYLLESTGSGFLAAQAWYIVNRSEFNFTALKFACPGDFNGNDLPDIAVFYNYFGTAPETKQSVFLFESEGDSFSLLPVAYEASKASYDFSHMKFALSGDYNLDGRLGRGHQFHLHRYFQCDALVDHFENVFHFGGDDLLFEGFEVDVESEDCDVLEGLGQLAVCHVLRVSVLHLGRHVFRQLPPPVRPDLRVTLLYLPLRCIHRTHLLHNPDGG